MATTQQLTESIKSFRAESAPDSVTPERVGALLQAIVDLLKALSMVPDTEVTNIMQALNTALTTAEAASTAANNALNAANNKYIALIQYDATATGVTFTIKQTGHTAKSVAVPVADASKAGIILPETLQSITDAAALAARNRLTTISLSFTSAGMTMTFKDAEGTTMYSRTLPLVTTTHPGLMSASDKTKLDNLPNGGFVSLDAAGRVPAAQAPVTMLRNLSGGAPDILRNGDFYFDQGAGQIYFHRTDNEDVPLGPPSKNIIYCHVDTSALYRWTGSSFVPALTDPNYAMQVQEVRKNTATQKIYFIPNGVLANVITNSDVVNISLVPANSGASVHRMVFSADNFNDCEQINWPSGLVWKNGQMPNAELVDDNYGMLVTIYDNKWAEFNLYSE